MTNIATLESYVSIQRPIASYYKYDKTFRSNLFYFLFYFFTVYGSNLFCWTRSTPVCSTRGSNRARSGNWPETRWARRPSRLRCWCWSALSPQWESNSPRTPANTPTAFWWTVEINSTYITQCPNPVSWTLNRLWWWATSVNRIKRVRVWGLDRARAARSSAWNAHKEIVRLRKL